VRREASPFSSSVGVRKIMNRFVVIPSASETLFQREEALVRFYTTYPWLP